MDGDFTTISYHDTRIIAKTMLYWAGGVQTLTFNTNWESSMFSLKKFCLVLFSKNSHIIDKSVFAFIFNATASVLGRNVRVKWCGNNFIVSDSLMPHVGYRFRHHAHAAWAYRHGLIARAKYLEEVYFLNQIDFKNGDIFLDCGANVGDLKLYFHVNNINVEYIAFEPSLIEFECLKHNIAPSKAFNIGLWKNEGVLPFYISSEMADSSFIKPVKYDDIVNIPTKRLEEFITKPIKCLKLEAEGGEPEVIEGIGDKLNLIEYITADLGPERGMHGEATLAPVTNFLLNQGFVMQDYTDGRMCALYRNTKFSGR